MTPCLDSHKMHILRVVVWQEYKGLAVKSGDRLRRPPPASNCGGQRVRCQRRPAQGYAKHHPGSHPHRNARARARGDVQPLPWPSLRVPGGREGGGWVAADHPNIKARVKKGEGGGCKEGGKGAQIGAPALPRTVLGRSNWGIRFVVAISWPCCEKCGFSAKMLRNVLRSAWYVSVIVPIRA